MEVQKEIITLPEDVELITDNDESNSKNAQEEESIKPNAVIKKSKRYTLGPYHVLFCCIEKSEIRKF